MTDDELRAYRRAYNERNKEKLREQRRAYYERNREAMLAKQREYNATHRDELIAKQRAHYAQNRETVRAAGREYARNNREKRKAYVLANRDAINAQRRRRQQDPKVRERQRAAAIERNRSLTDEQREQRNASLRRWYAKPGNAERCSMSRRKYEYGLQPGDFEALLDVQSGRCALCSREFASLKSKRLIHVDHDHETGHVRGILCRKCNNALGAFGDNRAGLMRALAYVAARPLLASELAKLSFTDEGG